MENVRDDNLSKAKGGGRLSMGNNIFGSEGVRLGSVSSDLRNQIRLFESIEEILYLDM